MISKGIMPCFWRAPIDNDKGGEESSYLSRWKAANMDRVVFAAKSCSILNITDHLVKVAVVYLGSEVSGSELEKQTALFEVDMIYTIYGSGDVIIECNVRPCSTLPPLPRVGVEFQLEKSLERIMWYGKGPFECYPDRKAAAQVGVYDQLVKDMHVPYVVPGESGGRADVRWVTFQNNDGVGIYASIYGNSPPMQMSASYYSTAELERARHNDDLVKGENIEVLSYPSSLFSLHQLLETNLFK